MPFTVSPSSITVTNQPPNTDLVYGLALEFTDSGSTGIWNNATVPPTSDFTLQNLPGFPLSMQAGTASAVFNFQITINKPIGVYSTIVTLTTSQGTFTVPVSVTIAQTTAFTVTPATLSFPGTVIGTTSQSLGVAIIGGASPVAISAPVFSNPDFAMTGSSSPFPNELFPGATITVDVAFTPSVQGIDTGTMTIQSTNLADAFVVNLVGVGLLFIEQNALKGTDYVFLMGFGPTSDVQQVDIHNLDSELPQTLTFNGTLWDGVSSEKVIRRLQFYYENIGVCTLTATAHVQRYNPDGTIFMDIQKSVVTFGTDPPDNWEYSAFFDFQLAGEIIYVDIAREASAGPCSLYQFVPFIEDKGEKVESK